MKNKISNILLWIVIIIALIFAFKFYKTNNFNEFIRSEMTLHTSKFKRDNEVKYSKSDSYKIVSNEVNDATFYKKVRVQKNTPYKVTCMVKTENVISEKGTSGVGAQISIVGTTEKSMAVTGNSDWQKIEMIFNSKNREEVDIGFRLGGYLGKCTGTAWFSDFTIEAGVLDDSNNWNFACFIFEDIDVVVDNKKVKISMIPQDIIDIKDTISRFQTSVRDMSNRKMTANCDTYIIKQPITKLSYDEEFGYYVAAEDIENIIKDTVNKNDYDHIFVVIRLGDEKHQKDIEINDWIGLRLNGLLWNRV